MRTLKSNWNGQGLLLIITLSSLLLVSGSLVGFWLANYVRTQGANDSDDRLVHQIEAAQDSLIQYRALTSVLASYAEQSVSSQDQPAELDCDSLAGTETGDQIPRDICSALSDELAERADRAVMTAYDGPWIKVSAVRKAEVTFARDRSYLEEAVIRSSLHVRMAEICKTPLPSHLRTNPSAFSSMPAEGKAERELIAAYIDCTAQNLTSARSALTHLSEPSKIAGAPWVGKLQEDLASIASSGGSTESQQTRSALADLTVLSIKKAISDVESKEAALTQFRQAIGQ